jgi:hypothetical protein
MNNLEPKLLIMQVIKLFYDVLCVKKAQNIINLIRHIWEEDLVYYRTHQCEKHPS